jgi:hypothetical protein
LFLLDLWNQWVAGDVWLQTIDFKYFGRKIFGLNNLRGLRRKKQIPCGMTEGKAQTTADFPVGVAERNAKAKAAQMARPFT